MKPLRSAVVILVALTCAAAAQADTVYYGNPGGSGIESVEGTIVQETDSFVTLETEDGRTVSIPKDDVLKVIRGTAAPSGYADMISGSTLDRSSSSGGRELDLDEGTYGPTRIYHYGFKGGMNVSNMSVDPAALEENDSLKSYALGAWLGTPLNRHLAIQAEALYSVKGDSETAGGYTASTRMAYIDVPVVAKIGFLHDAPARPSLFAGPSVAINVSANSKLEGEGLEEEVDVKDAVNTFDLGLVVGGGVDFAVGKRTLGVELRYSKGLTNVAGDGANGSAHNDVLAILGSIGLQ